MYKSSIQTGWASLWRNNEDVKSSLLGWTLFSLIITTCFSREVITSLFPSLRSGPALQSQARLWVWRRVAIVSHACKQDMIQHNRILSAPTILLSVMMPKETTPHAVLHNTCLRLHNSRGTGDFEEFKVQSSWWLADMMAHHSSLWITEGDTKWSVTSCDMKIIPACLCLHAPCYTTFSETFLSLSCVDFFRPPCKEAAVGLNTSSVFHNISFSTVMMCEGRQKCSLQLRIKTALQLTGTITVIDDATTLM